MWVLRAYSHLSIQRTLTLCVPWLRNQRGALLRELLHLGVDALDAALLAPRLII